MAYLKIFAGAIIIGNVAFFFKKNATTFGNALYNGKNSKSNNKILANSSKFSKFFFLALALTSGNHRTSQCTFFGEAKDYRLPFSIGTLLELFRTKCKGRVVKLKS